MDCEVCIAEAIGTAPGSDATPRGSLVVRSRFLSWSPAVMILWSSHVHTHQKLNKGQLESQSYSMQHRISLTMCVVCVFSWIWPKVINVSWSLSSSYDSLLYLLPQVSDQHHCLKLTAHVSSLLTFHREPHTHLYTACIICMHTTYPLYIHNSRYCMYICVYYMCVYRT